MEYIKKLFLMKIITENAALVLELKCISELIMLTNITLLKKNYIQNRIKIDSIDF